MYAYLWTIASDTAIIFLIYRILSKKKISYPVTAWTYKKTHCAMSILIV